MKSLFDAFERDFLLLDGAMGTMLIEMGMPCDQPSDLWNLTNPDRVLSVHQRYVLAGSDILLTNTFGTARLYSEQSGDVGELKKLNLKAVHLARCATQTANRPIWIAGDVGPVSLHGLNAPSLNKLWAIYHEHITWLVMAGCDLIVLETFLDFSMLETAILAAKTVFGETQKDLPLMALMTFLPKFSHTPKDLVVLSQKYQLSAIGVNCMAPQEMILIVQDLQSICKSPICVKPNAGLPLQQNDRLTFPYEMSYMAEEIATLTTKGARIVGGCCGTTPELIAMLDRNKGL